MLDIDIAQQLFPNPTTMIVQLLSTAVLFYVVSKYLWKPARDLLEKRSQTMHEQLSLAAQNLEDAENEKMKAHEEVSSAYHRSQEIISQAEIEAKAIGAEMLEQAKKDASAKLEKAREQIQIEKNQMRQEMVEEMVSVAMLAAEKLIEEKVDRDQDQKAIEHFVKEMSNQHGTVS